MTATAALSCRVDRRGVVIPATCPPRSNRWQPDTHLRRGRNSSPTWQRSSPQLNVTARSSSRTEPLALLTQEGISLRARSPRRPARRRRWRSTQRRQWYRGSTLDTKVPQPDHPRQSRRKLRIQPGRRSPPLSGQLQDIVGGVVPGAAGEKERSLRALQAL